jgi:anaerobic selenocysteine-containing dehydrogenase
VAAEELLRGPEALRAGEAAAPPREEWVPTTCWIGKQDCGIMARRIDGRVVKLEGHPGNSRNAGTLCPKGQAQIVALYDPNRVKAPLIRTNAKGEHGTWRRASWDEALELVAERIRAARAKDPSLVVWQKGRSKSKLLYDEALVEALGATKVGHGAYCSDAGYRALEYTIGVQGVLNPDFRYTRYLLSCPSLSRPTPPWGSSSASRWGGRGGSARCRRRPSSCWPGCRGSAS